MLQVGQEMLEEEAREAEREKMQYLEENCTALFIPGSMQDLQVNLRHLENLFMTDDKLSRLFVHLWKL